MAADMALQKAAGIIMHHLNHGKTIEYAIGMAEKHEPELTESDIGAAYDWALAALRLVEMAAPLARMGREKGKRPAPGTKRGTRTIAQLLDAAGVPWRPE